tara:strand:+ start:293 stop:529 length:237 start_codon:yes stop_codon:yes gene_type:complete
MASKNSYLIKVWQIPKKGNVSSDNKDKIIDSTSDGFELAQEKIIKCYDKDIKNIRVAKGYRATYEEYKEKSKTKTARI